MWQHVHARPAPCLDLEVIYGVPGLQGVDIGPRAHLRRGYKPAGGANFSVPHSVILNFLLGSRRRAPRGAGAGGPRGPTINAKKRVDSGPPEGFGARGPVVGDVDGGPLGGASGRSGSGHHQS
jgi:hypothetical protein